MNRILLNLFSLMLVFITLSSEAHAQVRKLRSSSFASKYKINDYKWSEWSDPSEASILITIDSENQRIIIHSEEKQIYDIAE